MMDEKQRSILDRNRELLINNIIMNEDFFKLLRSDSVLPGSMVNDIQMKKSQQERNVKLLETLQLRGGAAYMKLCNILYLTGHQFLADHLYGEDIENKLLREEEIFQKFPNVFKHISDDTKSKLLKYLETKVREKLLTHAWLVSSSDRNGQLDARKMIYDAEKDCKRRLDAKTQKMNLLKDEIRKLTDKIKKQAEEICRLQNELTEAKRCFKDDLTKQARFNAANNQSIIHLRAQLDTFNERIRLLNIAMQEVLDTNNQDFDDDRHEGVELSELESNVKMLMQMAKACTENASTNVNEKEFIFNLFQASSYPDHKTLSEVVQKYVETQEKANEALFKELESALVILRGDKRSKVCNKPSIDMNVLNVQAALIREEVQHIKKKLVWKDAHISDLLQEINELKENEWLKHSHNKFVKFPPIAVPHLYHESLLHATKDTTKNMIRSSKHCNSYIDEASEQSELYQDFHQCGSHVKSDFNETLPSEQASRRTGSLAEMNLERHVSPPSGFNRQRSRINTTDLDILGPSKQYRQSIIKEKSDTFKDLGNLLQHNVITPTLNNESDSIREHTVIKPGLNKEHPMYADLRKRRYENKKALILKHVRDNIQTCADESLPTNEMTIHSLHQES